MLADCSFGAFGVDPAKVGHASETDLTTGWIEGSDPWFSEHLTKLESRQFPFSRNLVAMDGILQVRCVENQCVLCWQFIPEYSRKRSTSTRRVARFPLDRIEELVPTLAHAFRRTPRQPSTRQDLLEPASIAGYAQPALADMLLLLGYTDRYPGTALSAGKTLCPGVSADYDALCHIAWSCCRRRGDGCALVVYSDHPPERDGEEFDEAGWDLLLAPGSRDGGAKRMIDHFDPWPDDRTIRGATPTECLQAYQRLFKRWKVQETEDPSGDNNWLTRLNIPMRCLDPAQVPKWEWDHWVDARCGDNRPAPDVCTTIAWKIIKVAEDGPRMTLRLIEVLAFMDRRAEGYDELCRRCLAQLDLDPETIDNLLPASAAVR